MTAVSTAAEVSRATSPVRRRQPLLHDLTVCLAAPTTVLGGPDGQIRPVGAQGAFHADVRVVSRLEVRVGGHEPEAVSDGPAGPGGHDFVALLRSRSATTGRTPPCGSTGTGRSPPGESPSGCGCPRPRCPA